MQKCRDINVFLFRMIRYQIVEICEYIYKQEWDRVCEYWEKLEPGLTKIISQNEAYYKVLCEIVVCMERRNYLRFRDLLVYEIDFFVAQQLRSLDEEERKNLSKEARRRNEEALEAYHPNIWRMLQKRAGINRIEYSYIGTENVSISIKEKNEIKFRLFSNVNPWLESMSMIRDAGRESMFCGDIHVLGFGGGYLAAGLAKKYPDAGIKVYLPNLDIFQAVIEHIPIVFILKNKNIELIPDPMGIDFFMELGNKNFAYIDWQELRACAGKVEVTDKLMAEYKHKLHNGAKNNIITDHVGRNIYCSMKKDLL